MDWIDQKYIGLLSNRLQRFKRVNNSLFNFRCPLCGDSKKDKFKARGYIMEKPVVGTVFYCHNCHESISFKNLIGRIDSELSEQYVRERFLERNTPEQPEKKEEKPDISKIVVPQFLKGDSPLKQLKKISQLDAEHPVKKYVQKRQIPASVHYKLFYAPKFKAWVNTIIPEKFDLESGDEPRLIIPFLDKDGNLFGFQGRSFKPDGIRYITIMIDESKPKVFGLDTVNEKGKIYVVEGPIDSMFMPNCIAMAGSSVNLSNVFPNKPREEIVVVMDNEPRNGQIVKQIDKYIDEGYSVCIWPEDIAEKDINDMVLHGLDPEMIIVQNVRSGLMAKAALSQWKKI
jgi:hypothetical protein